MSTQEFTGYQLSPVQQGHLLRDTSAGSTGVQAILKVDPDQDTELLKKALFSFAEAREVFAIRLERKPGMRLPLQVVQSDAQINWEVAKDDILNLQTMAAAEFDKAETGIRALLLQNPTRTGHLIITLPASLGDGQTLNLLIEYLRTALESGSVTEPEEEEITFTQYADWQCELLAASEEDATLFWEGYAWQEGSKAVHPFVQTECKPVESLSSLPEVLTDQIRTRARELDTTVEGLMLLAWYLLLKRHLGGKPLTIAYIDAARPFDELLTIAGRLAKPLPYQIDTTTGDNLAELLSQSKQLLESLRAWEDYFPAAGNGDSVSDFQIGFEYLSQNQDHQTLPVQEFRSRLEPFGIALQINESVNRIDYRIRVQAESFPEFLPEQYETLLGALLGDPKASLSKVNFTGPAEQDLLQNGDLQTLPIAYSHILNAIEWVRDAHPKSRAITAPGIFYTYSELWSESNQMAHWLLKHQDIKPGDRVALMLSDQPATIAVILALWKLGAAYVPIDAAYPESRRKFMLNDSQASLLIVEGNEDIKEDCRVLKFEDLLSGSKASPDQLPQVALRPDLPAYIIYTSGSTGQPKGVLLNHSSIPNLLEGLRHRLGAENDWNYVLTASLSFDASIKEIFMPLTAGGTLFLWPELRDLNGLLSYIDKQPIHTVHASPAVWRAMLASRLPSMDFPHLKLVSSGGDRLDQKLAGDLREAFPDRKLFNLYGPTEICVNALGSEVFPTDQNPNIGQPLPNYQAFILDSEGQICPTGVPGELSIGGPGLAAGYWDDQDKTTEKFKTYTFEESLRVYHTGDRCRRLPNGDYEFLGRMDSQVKVRGYRIEPEEIRKNILEVPGVEQALVIAKSSPDGHFLAAYFVPESIEGSAVRSFLENRLPEFMLPDYLVPLSSMPLAPSGKIDASALPDPTTRKARSSGKLPSTKLETLLHRIWEQVLDARPIGIEDNFFEIGGHSLKAIRMIAQLHKEADIRLDVGTVFTYPNIELLAAHIESIDRETYIPIPATEAATDYPLSLGQQRLWVLHQLTNAGAAYNMPGAIELRGPFNVAALNSAWKDLIRRHEVLRTIFVETASGPRQKILGRETFDLVLNEISLTDQSEPREKLNQLILKEAARPFDLENGPLVRISLFKLADDHHILFFNLHHIISDGWSIPLMAEELLDTYTALAAGQEAASTLPSVQYKEYATWQRNELESGAWETHKNWWMDQFADLPPALELPVKGLRPAFPDFKGARERVQLDSEQLKNLRTLCQDQNASLFAGILTLTYALLYRYTGQEDLVIGSPEAGRDHPDLQNQLGYFVNTLALRSAIDPQASFKEYVVRVQNEFQAAYTHRFYPLDLLVDDLELPRDLSRAPLFDVVLVMQNNDDALASRDFGEQIQAQAYNFADPFSKFDLSILIREEAEGLEIEFEYAKALFAPETIRAMAQHFLAQVQAALNHPDQPIASLPILSTTELDQILSFNPPVLPIWEDTIGGLFEKQVAQNPEAEAISDSYSQLSYADLNVQVNRLAHFLHEKGIGKGDFIGLHAHKSISSVVAILGVLKTGATYVPIDPMFPTHRKTSIVEDAGIKWFIEPGAEKANLQGIQEIDLGKVLADESISIENPGIAVATDSSAGLIYTSGSTGKPKGVILNHRGLINVAQDHIERFNLGVGERIIQFIMLAGDGAALDICMTLFSGATLVLVDRDTVADAREFIDFVDRQRLSYLTMPPSYLKVLNRAEMPSVKTIVTAGEVANPEDALHYAQHKAYYNAYGPTEASVNISIHRLDPEQAWNFIPIGQPGRNKSVYILDRNQQITPMGLSGEIYVGGAISSGYLGLTEGDSFVENPMVPGENLYRTGDLGAWLPDGNLRFLGRADQQLKIRGYRVEPAEIEHVLREHPQIQDVVVTAPFGNDGNAYLAAYISGNESGGERELRTWLADRLPVYMCPEVFVKMDVFPRTATGKIDRKALPDPVFQPTEDVLLPENEVERRLVGLWAEVLGRPENSIGRDKNFFELGGNSLKATQVVARIRTAFETDLPLRTLFAAPTIRDIAGHLADGSPTALKSISKQPDASHYPLSHAQKRLWILQQLDLQSNGYNLGMALYLDGNLDLEAFRLALKKLVDRHEILRTTFASVEGLPQQFVSSTSNFELEYEDVQTDIFDEEFHYKALVHPAFDLESGPLFRGKIFQTGPEQHFLTFAFHHIITDGWSMQLMITELIESYNLAIRNDDQIQTPLELQYRDYSAWQNEMLQNGGLQQEQEYWLDRLGGDLPVLNLQSDFGRPALRTYRGAYTETQVPTGLTLSLEKLAHEAEGSLFMVLMAAVNTLLHRQSGDQDILIGTPVAGRVQTELEPQLGMYLNTLVHRNEVHAKMSFRDLLQEVKVSSLEALDHQNYPFDLLVDDLDLVRDRSRSPIFDVVVVLQNQQSIGPDLPTMQGLQTTPFEPKTTRSLVDLRFEFVQIPEGIYLRLEYNADLFHPDRMVEMVKQLERILEAAADHPDGKVSEIELFTPALRKELQQGFGYRSQEFPHDATMHSLIETVAAQQPNHTAIQIVEERLSYGELNAAANLLAHELRDNNGVGKGDFVGVMLPRSTDMMVAVLAILKSGGAWLPIETELPLNRRNFMLQDAGVKFLITDSEHMFDHLDYGGGLFAMDIQFDGLEHPNTNPEPLATATDPAYLIYTSGSTGKPKGVVVSHQSNVNMALDQVREFELQPEDGVLQFASLSFDASVYEISMGLYAGARLILLPPQPIRDPNQFVDYLQSQEVTVATLPPPFLDTLPLEKLNFLRVIVTAGDAPNPAHALKLAESVTYYNAYGPTECAVCVSYHQVSEADQGAERISIGRGVANMELLVLDQNLQLVPQGVPGELYVAGPGLASGYLNRDEEQARRFVAHPFKEDARIYRTGDQVKWNQSGNLEFLGRVDQQVKIRGYRIEPGEITEIIRTFVGIEGCFVSPKPEPGGNLQLVAWYVGESVKENELRQHLETEMPSYMVPAHFVRMDELPSTNSGKIDTKALPAPTGIAPTNADHIAPADALEENLVRLLGEVLGLEQSDGNHIGMEQDFFAIGGNSLNATQVVVRVAREMNAKLDIGQIFAEPGIANMAQNIRNGVKTEHIEIPRLPDQSFYPLSHAQHRMWILSRLEATGAAYHLPVLLEIKGPFDQVAFRSAVELLIEKHAALRTIVVEKADGPVQELQTTELSMRGYYHKDLRAHADADTRAQYLAESLVEEGFDFATGPLWRMAVVQLEENRTHLLISMHHIVCDGWSMGILIPDLFDLYESVRNKLPNENTAQKIRYVDYADWQRGRLSGAYLANLNAFWLDYLADAPVLSLPTDHPRPAVQTFEGKVFRFALDQELTEDLQRYAQERQASLFQMVLTLFNILLARQAGQSDLIVGTPVSGRSHADLENVVGLLLNTLPIRTKLPEEGSFSKALQIVRESSLSVFEHQELPFDEIVRQLDLPRDLSRSPVFDVMLLFQNIDSGNEALHNRDGIEVSPIGDPKRWSKVDLTLIAYEEAGALNCTFEYNADLFEEQRIREMAEQFVRLTREALQNEEVSWKKMSLLGKEWKKSLMEGPLPGPEVPELTLDQILQAKAESMGDQIAIEGISENKTYQDLLDRSRSVAAFLQTKLSQNPGSPVALLMDRSPEMVAMLWGVMRSGCPYVPIDIRQPQARIDDILDDLQPALVIASDANIELSYPVLQPAELQSDGEPVQTHSPDDLAYIIYTSGSTGKPKGVKIPHRALVNFLLTMAEFPGLTSEDRLLSVTTYAFDISILEFFLPLIQGATLILADEDTIREPGRLMALITSSKPTIMQATPSHWQILRDSGWTGQSNMRVLSGGEPLSDTLAEWLVETSSEVFNMYGPTETTIWSTTGKLHKGDRTHIGKPIGGTRVFILDPDGEPVPSGVWGELCIEGLGVAAGYYRNPELSAEKFTGEGEMKRFTTGDRGRWAIDGVLEIAGRMDAQLKIRGYRVEPAEIRQVMLKFEGIEEAAVTGIEGGSGGKSLLGAYTSSEPISEPALRAFLNQCLPAYMIPDQLVRLEAMPLTVNGKIDYKTLVTKLPSASSVASPLESPIERTMAKLWMEVTGIVIDHSETDLLAHGGNSLAVVQFVSKLQKETGHRVRLSEIYNRPTFSGLSELIELGENILKLVPMNQHQEGLESTVLIPPIFGEVSGMQPLADKLEGKRNCWGLDYPLWVNNLEELLEEALQSILRAELPGKITLVGYSMGAVVAFELSKMLDKYDKETFLILLDLNPIADLTAEIYDIEAVQAELREVLGIDDEEISKEIARRIQWLRHYLPEGKVQVPILAVEATGSSRQAHMEDWQKYSEGEFDHIYVPAGHTTMLEPVSCDAVVNAWMNFND